MNRTDRTDHPALVVLSGGQDSATCLATALDVGYPSVQTITFDYGQRHRVELDCAAELCRRWGVAGHVVKVDQLRQLVSSALLDDTTDIAEPHARMRDVPASFVPARNALFLTLAHALAQEINARTIYTGVCQTDYSGYPDCRHDFIDAMEAALNIGYQSDIRIKTPLMYLSKAQTFELAYHTGRLGDIIEFSHTCYNGDRSHRYVWGYGCGECPACKLRANGYFQFIDSRDASFHP